MSDDKKTKSWGCSECKGPEFSEGDELRSFRNCESETNESIGFTWMPELRRCPWSSADPNTLEVFRWWTDWYQFKILPWSGTLSEQPAFVVEAIQFCEEIRLEVESVSRDAIMDKSK